MWTVISVELVYTLKWREEPKQIISHRLPSTLIILKQDDLTEYKTANIIIYNVVGNQCSIGF